MEAVGKRLLFCLAFILLQVVAFWAGSIKPKLPEADAVTMGSLRGIDIPDNYIQTIILPEAPERQIVWKKNSVTAVVGGTETFLTGGSPVYGVYFTDLNGDGTREMVAEISTGGSTPTDVIVIYDFVLGSTRTMDEPKKYNYTAESRDGVVYVTKKPYGKPDAKGETGRLYMTSEGLFIED